MTDAPTLLGDVVICPEVAYRNAPEHAGTYEDELALLLVHGILHLLGYDHADAAEEREMFGLQDEIVSEWRARSRPPAAPPRRPGRKVKP